MKPSLSTIMALSLPKIQTILSGKSSTSNDYDQVSLESIPAIPERPRHSKIPHNPILSISSAEILSDPEQKFPLDSLPIDRWQAPTTVAASILASLRHRVEAIPRRVASNPR